MMNITVRLNMRGFVISKNGDVAVQKRISKKGELTPFRKGHHQAIGFICPHRSAPYIGDKVMIAGNLNKDANNKTSLTYADIMIFVENDLVKFL